MGLLTDLGTMMESTGPSAKADSTRLMRLKKLLNLKENESIKTVPDTRLQKFAECYGKMASEGLKRYSELTEDVSEKSRIGKILASLGM